MPPRACIPPLPPHLKSGTPLAENSITVPAEFISLNGIRHVKITDDCAYILYNDGTEVTTRGEIVGALRSSMELSRGRCVSTEREKALNKEIQKKEEKKRTPTWWNMMFSLLFGTFWAGFGFIFGACFAIHLFNRLFP